MYWAWWISWVPFVGLFIAKISRGRTIREFVVCVLLIPTVFNLLWMTVIMALPFSLIMVVMAFCLLRGLWVDDSYFSRNLSKSTAYWDGKHWQARLQPQVHAPRGTADRCPAPVRALYPHDCQQQA